MKKTIFASFFTVLILGCAPGSVRTDVETTTDVKYDTVTIANKEGENSAYLTTLKKELNSRLADDFNFGGDGLKIQLELLHAREGNRIDRWFWGPMAGQAAEGIIKVRVNYLTPDGKDVGTITVTGKIIVGVFGGSFDSAIESAAKQIYKFTVDEFRP